MLFVPDPINPVPTSLDNLCDPFLTHGTRLKMSTREVVRVNEFTTTLHTLLEEAKDLKPVGDIDPALSAQDLEGGIGRLSILAANSGNQAFAIIETACRDIFYKILVSQSNP